MAAPGFSYLPDAGFCSHGRVVGLPFNPPLHKQLQVLIDLQGRRICKYYLLAHLCGDPPEDCMLDVLS